MNLPCLIIQAYIIVVIVRVIFSFIPMDEGSIVSSIGQVAYLLTEPVLAPIRRALPRIGDLPVDFSPAVVILVLGVVRSLICT